MHTHARTISGTSFSFLSELEEDRLAEQMCRICNHFLNYVQGETFAAEINLAV